MPAGCDSNCTSVYASFLTRPCQAHQYLLMRTLADEGEGQNLPPEAVRQLASAATRLSFPVPSAEGSFIYIPLTVCGYTAARGCEKVYQEYMVKYA